MAGFIGILLSGHTLMVVLKGYGRSELDDKFDRTGSPEHRMVRQARHHLRRNFDRQLRADAPDAEGREGVEQADHQLHRKEA